MFDPKQTEQTHARAQAVIDLGRQLVTQMSNGDRHKAAETRKNLIKDCEAALADESLSESDRQWFQDQLAAVII